MSMTEAFQAERPRLVSMATRILGDHAEAEDVVQQAWLRLAGTDAEIESLPAWLTTVTTRLCLDRLRARTPIPMEELEPSPLADDPAESVALADSVGVALQMVLDRLSPQERVAFVLHDSFGFDFATVAAILDTTRTAARKLASRARAKVQRPGAGAASSSAAEPEEPRPDWAVVDAFMAAAREGDFERLLRLLAPDAVVSADAAAIRSGTPQRIEGRREIATFFNGSAQSALAVFVGERPGSAWFFKGEAKVVFDFSVAGGLVTGITFRAEPDLLSQVARRDGGVRRS